MKVWSLKFSWDITWAKYFSQCKPISDPVLTSNFTGFVHKAFISYHLYTHTLLNHIIGCTLKNVQVPSPILNCIHRHICIYKISIIFVSFFNICHFSVAFCTTLPLFYLAACGQMQTICPTFLKCKYAYMIVILSDLSKIHPNLHKIIINWHFILFIFPQNSSLLLVCLFLVIHSLTWMHHA